MQNEQNNPYATGAAVIQDHYTRQQSELASRGSRLLASFIDGLVLSAFYFPILYFVFEVNLFDLNPTFSKNLGMAAFAMFVFWGINGYWLYEHGQTLGKKAVGIRIVQSNGQPASIAQIAFRRTLPIQLLNAFPLLTFLTFIDALFIFGEKRQCVHDLIADTKVINV